MYTTATSIYNSSKHHQPKRKSHTHSHLSTARATTYLPSDSMDLLILGILGLRKEEKPSHPGSVCQKQIVEGALDQESQGLCACSVMSDSL